METTTIIWLCVAAFVVFVLLPLLVMSYFLFSVLLVRTKKEKWQRGCSAPDDPISKQMFDEGRAWAEKNAYHRREEQIQSGRFRLYGEYYDFGSDRTVFILGGRTESLMYGYYFAGIYEKLGCNVLVADPRAHGKSDGRINSVGFREWRDVIAWGRLIHEKYGINRIFLHGICIGSETGLFVLTSKHCPDYFRGMCAEGMFTTFSETFRTHMIHQKKPTFPMLYFVMLWLFLTTGARAVTDGPIRRIGRLNKPILFLHSKEDKYSLPRESVKIYEKCPSPHETVWFEHGEHSRIRIVDKEKYDKSVESFFLRYFV